MLKSGKPAILCIGHDHVLNRTRRLVFEKCFEVEVAQSLPEALARLVDSRFDLVLFCYSLTDEECRAAVEFIRGLPAPPKILALAQGRRRLELGDRDEEFVPDGPAELLMKAAMMAGISRAEAKRCASAEPLQ